MKRSRRALPILLVGAGTLLSGCLSPPDHRADIPYGAVYAPSPGVASSVARQTVLDVQEVRRLLPGGLRASFDVWVVEEVAPPPFFAGRVREHFSACTSHAFYRSPRIYVSRDVRPVSLAHELVHAMIDESWDPLPAVIEEGLADWVSYRLHLDGQQRLARVLSAMNLPEGHQVPVWIQVSVPDGEPAAWVVSLPTTGLAPSSLTAEDVLAIPGGTRWGGMETHDLAFAYATGFVLVDRLERRIGIDGLLDLCLTARESGRGRLSPEEILSCAGLSAGEPVVPDRELQRLVLETVFAESGFASVVKAVLVERRELLDETPEVFLERVTITPVLLPKIEQGGVDLRELDGYREEVTSSWEEIVAEVRAAGSP